MFRLGLLAAALALIPLSAMAEDSVPEAMVEAEQPQMAPAEITPEQKINTRDDLQKNIQNSVVKADIRERRRLLDALNTLRKNKVARSNLDKAPQERAQPQEPNVDVRNRKDMQKYMQDIFVAPLDDSFATPEIEE